MAKKTLKCKFKDHWNHYPIKELLIDDIWQSVPPVDILPTIDKPFKSNLINDIKRDGMHFPIMACYTTRVELIKAKEKWGDFLSGLPFWHNDINPHVKKLWSCWGGSQRLDAAKQLGYTHIDAAVLPSISKAISHQKEMRKPFESRYYEN
jgi:hypothetical protein